MSLFWIPTSRRLSLIVSRILHIRSLSTTNWNGKLKKSSIHDSAVVVSFTKFAGRITLHPMTLGNLPAISLIPRISSTSSTPATPTNLVLLHVLTRVPVLVLVLQPNFNCKSIRYLAREYSSSEVLATGEGSIVRIPCHNVHSASW
jgi:hypothetical protein